MIHQELIRCLICRVYENVYMGRELKRGPDWWIRRENKKETQEIIGIAWIADLANPDDAG